MLIEQPPRIFRMLYPNALWRMDPSEKSVYLTFDDGPIPRVTPWVLDLLDSSAIKATFFMVGDNARKYPTEYQQVIDRGHRIGNHTYNHVRGLQIGIEEYIRNTEKANQLFHTDLFRPPHGFMTRAQYQYASEHYKIVMWDLVTRDYSKRLDGKQVFRNIRQYVRNGSIITFHDSLKSEDKLKYALPRSIEWMQEQGYAFKTF